MATLTAPGGHSFSISAEHIAQHPNSLLASMLADVGGGGDNAVTLELDLNAATGVGSPLADWAEAASITSDLYRCVAVVLHEYECS
jgi:hypothetical protein